MDADRRDAAARAREGAESETGEALQNAYYSGPWAELYHGDCVELMSRMEANSLDAIVTDPPYGLELMSLDWDRLSGPNPWEYGGGFAKPGIGERERPWPSFSATGRFGSANPTCARCGGRARGKKRCSCEEPDWKPIGRRRKHYDAPEGMTGTGQQGHMKRMQEWHERWAREAIKVLKPGGFLLAMGGDRTEHRMTCAIEDAGFEVRQKMPWIHAQGFPKNLNVGRELSSLPWCGCEPGEHDGDAVYKMDPHNAKNRAYAGFGRYAPVLRALVADGKISPCPGCGRPVRPEWARDGAGTALRPAVEMIVVARKPLARGSVAENVLCYGTGALNVDACRIEIEEGTKGVWGSSNATVDPERTFNGSPDGASYRSERHPLGRWPANLVLSCCELEPDEAPCPDCPVAELDGQSGLLRSGANPERRSSDKFRSIYGEFRGESECVPARGADAGGASRFFFCAKASRAEREEGLDGFEERPLLWSSGAKNPGSFQSAGTKRASRNPHPTTKPRALMRWLIRLVARPDARILDPFCGSGTTGVAATLEGVHSVLIERETQYLPIARARLEHAAVRGPEHVQEKLPLGFGGEDQGAPLSEEPHPTLQGGLREGGADKAMQEELPLTPGPGPGPRAVAGGRPDREGGI